MANPVKGEVTVNFGGQARKFRLGMNEVCTLERATGMSIATLLGPQRTMCFADLRDILLAGLQKHDPSLTAEDVGEMIAEHPNPGEIGSLVRQSLQEAMPHLFGGARPLDAATNQTTT